MIGRYALLGIEFPLPNDTSIKRYHTSDPDDWRIEYSKALGTRRNHPYYFGVCVPNACDQPDLKIILQAEKTREMIAPLSVRVITTESYSDPITYSWKQIAAGLIIVWVIFLSINSSLLIYFFPDWSISQIVKPFDVIHNLRELFSPVKHPDSMFTTINIIRANYVMTGIYMHVALGTSVIQIFRAESLASQREVYDKSSFTFIDMLDLATPSIMTQNIVLTGIFVALKWVPVMMKGNSISFMRYAIERMFRTWPVVAAYFLVTQTFPLIPFAGPLGKFSQEGYADVCYKNGWKELLFINNYSELKDICNPIAWFISAEFQLYIMTFFLLLLISKFPKRVVQLVAAQVVIGVIASGIHFQKSRTPPILSVRVIDVYEIASQFSARIYHVVHYISPYAIGMMLGLKLLQQKGQPVALSWNLIAVLITAVHVIFAAPYFLYDNGDTRSFLYGEYLELLYVSVCRTLAAAAWAIMYYLVFNTRTPWILQIAQSRLVTVMTRLTLSWYMVHNLFIILLFSTYETTESRPIQLMSEHLWIMAISFPSAVAMYVFVEAPFSKLLQLFLKKDPEKEE
jgi:peptidoglycan/LPS O-acetylase OafA/YrhL